MTFTVNLVAQHNYSPRPDPRTGNYTFFYYDSSASLKSVALTGTFNGWSPNSHPFKKKNENLWTASVKMTVGERIYYKMVLDGTKWIPDPNAPYITQDQFRNSVLIPIKADEFGLLSSNPIDEGTILRPKTLFFNFNDPSGILDSSSVTVVINGKNHQNFEIDEKTSQLIIRLSELLNGHQILEVKIQKEDFQFVKRITFYALEKPVEIQTPGSNNTSIVYEIFVRQFNDSNNDGIGDLDGVTEKLDYIQSLGANIIWLMPVNESPRDHGYAITDYRKIHQEYGGNEAFQRLIKSAHEKGMKIWMDYVINHSDSTHAFFLDAVKNGKKSKYWKWFQITNENPLKYNHFGSDRQMPKFDFSNPEVEQYFIDLAMYWMDPDQDGNCEDGFDGFRCDAAIEVPHEFWKKLRIRIKEKNPEFSLLGEIWADQPTILPFYENEFDMVFDYPLYYVIRDLVLEQKFSDFKSVINYRRENFPDQAQWVTFLSNHDNYRSISLFKDDFDLWKQATLIQYLLPGTPLIYYGDENGMKGKNPPDSNVRKKMNFSDKETKFRDWYRALAELRRQFPILCKSDTWEKPTVNFETSGSKTFQIERMEKGKTSLVVLFNPNFEMTVIDEQFISRNYDDELQWDPKTKKWNLTKRKSITISVPAKGFVLLVDTKE